MALDVSNIIEKTIDIHYRILFDYENMNIVMRKIKEHNLNIINQKLELACEIIISIRKSESDKIFEIFNSLFKVSIKKT